MKKYQLSEKEIEFIEAVRDFKKYNEPGDFEEYILKEMLEKLLYEEAQ